MSLMISSSDCSIRVSYIFNQCWSSCAVHITHAMYKYTNTHKYIYRCRWHLLLYMIPINSKALLQVYIIAFHLCTYGLTYNIVFTFYIVWLQFSVVKVNIAQQVLPCVHPARLVTSVLMPASPLRCALRATRARPCLPVVHPALQASPVLIHMTQPWTIPVRKVSVFLFE